MNENKVAVIGFGNIGSVVGAVLADKGQTVVGIDRDQRIVDAVNNGLSPFNEPGLQAMIQKNVAAGRLKLTQDLSAIEDCAYVIIMVGTPLSDEGEPDLAQITAAAKSIVPYVSKGQTFLIKSTVPPGTTEKLVWPILKEKAEVFLAFSPERVSEGRAIEELVAVPIVVGGVDAASTDRVATFVERAFQVRVVRVQSARAAELTKLADNLWIDLNIALAAELAKLSESLDIDVLEVIEAANSLPKGMHHVNILTPSVGVGGYCLTKDPWFVHRMGVSFGWDLQTPVVSRTVNDGLPEFSVSLIDRVLLSNGKKASDCKVGVLGIAFKTNTGDVRFTPVKPVIDALQKRGYNLTICDPWVSADGAKTVTELPMKSIEEAITGMDCVAFLTGHKEFQELSMARIAELSPGALVFDGRMFFSREKIAQMKALNLKYKGVGRG
ncbi:MAG: nucleotide sugar dehydrogenase [Leptospirales bacterium]|nr:nucleotide sugar dehydrogenase [Leptospirales bacterium]